MARSRSTKFGLLGLLISFCLPTALLACLCGLVCMYVCSCLCLVGCASFPHLHYWPLFRVIIGDRGPLPLSFPPAPILGSPGLRTHFFSVTISLPGGPVLTHKLAAAKTLESRVFNLIPGARVILASLHLMRSVVCWLRSSPRIW